MSIERKVERTLLLNRRNIAHAKTMVNHSLSKMSENIKNEIEIFLGDKDPRVQYAIISKVHQATMTTEEDEHTLTLTFKISVDPDMDHAEIIEKFDARSPIQLTGVQS